MAQGLQAEVKSPETELQIKESEHFHHQSAPGEQFVSLWQGTSKDCTGIRGLSFQLADSEQMSCSGYKLKVDSY